MSYELVVQITDRDGAPLKGNASRYEISWDEATIPDELVEELKEEIKARVDITKAEKIELGTLLNEGCFMVMRDGEITQYGSGLLNEEPEEPTKRKRGRPPAVKEESAPTVAVVPEVSLPVLPHGDEKKQLERLEAELEDALNVLDGNLKVKEELESKLESISEEIKRNEAAVAELTEAIAPLRQKVDSAQEQAKAAFQEQFMNMMNMMKQMGIDPKEMMQNL